MSFQNLGLRPELLSAITKRGYKTATPIQAQSIPKVLAGRDVLAGAQTGTGKTAAFALPIIQMLSAKKITCHRPRALILTPTRELAAQVLEFVEIYGRSLTLRSTAIFGGVNIRPQITKLRKGVDILVATPGRLLDHAGQRTLDLSHIEMLVLDEADRMLDMGFIHDIRKIIKLVPRKRQNLLFSATYSDDIKRLADGLLNNPAFIEVASRNTTADNIAQVVHPVSRRQKPNLLSKLITDGNWSQGLVFTRTKHGANKLTKQLIINGITARAIHGNKSQGARTRALADFKQGEVRILVATDIAARGLDINLLPHVVNYDLPDVAESYVHRIGRTGRAGANGQAVSLVCPEEHKELHAIHKLLGHAIPVEKIEGFTATRDPKGNAKRSQPSSSPRNRQRSSQKPGWRATRKPHTTKHKPSGRRQAEKESDTRQKPASRDTRNAEERKQKTSRNSWIKKYRKKRGRSNQEKKRS